MYKSLINITAYYLTLTSKGKDLSPYWNDSCAEISSRLLLPTETDYVDSDMNSSITWRNKTVEKSWFSTKLNSVPNKNLQMTYLTSSMSSPVECMGSENTVIKSKRIRIYPTKAQKLILKNYLGTARFVYNKTVEYLNKPDTKANWLGIKTEIIKNLPEWTIKTPYQIKSLAVFDACVAVKNAKAKFRKSKELQTVHFKSRKELKQSCFIPKSSIKEDGFYKRYLSKIIFKESLPENYKDSRLILYCDKWYLNVSYKCKTQLAENQGRVVALDPGVRSFIPFFSENSYGKLGNGDFGRITRLCVYLDNLMSRMSEAKAPQRRSMKKAAARIRFKIKSLVEELHYKTARFLVNNFDVILLPTFETKDMVLKITRKIKSKTARAMLTWAHYRFKMFLKHKAFEFGKVVVDVNEAYTSKTVSWTGELVHNLGGSKIIKSLSTGKKMDRDYNGARGIFLRALVDQPEVFNFANVNIC